VVEEGDTEKIFSGDADNPKTNEFVSGAFG
jgi:ABC-type phosphate transport system ATPase subunit